MDTKRGGWAQGGQKPQSGERPKYEANTNKKNYTLLQPGMVYFPMALSLPLQKWLVGISNSLSEILPARGVSGCGSLKDSRQ